VTNGFEWTLKNGWGSTPPFADVIIILNQDVDSEQGTLYVKGNRISMPKNGIIREMALRIFTKRHYHP
jgi:hypothetical protein